MFLRIGASYCEYLQNDWGISWCMSCEYAAEVKNDTIVGGTGNNHVCPIVLAHKKPEYYI